MRKIVVAAVGAAMATYLVSPLPAAAVGTGDPVIESPSVDPSHSSTYNAPFDGDVSVDFSDAPFGQYVIRLSNADNSTPTYSEESTVEYDTDSDGLNGRRSADFSQVSESGLYQVDVEKVDDPAVAVSGQFVVAPTIDVLQVSPAKFFPLVRDGYRDTADVNYSISGGTDQAVIRIRNSAGRLVRKVNLGELPGGDGTWTWNGRDNDGQRVPTGDYSVQLSLLEPYNGSQVRRTADVQVASHTEWIDGSRYRDGIDATSWSHTRSCYVRWNWEDNADVLLDCWGGRYALVRFKFRIPPSARNITWKVHPGDYSYCCGNGRVIKSGTRPQRRSYVVTVKATKWRAYDVSWVDLNFEYAKRT